MFGQKRTKYFEQKNIFGNHQLKQVNADGKRHYETPDGRKFVSVTTALGEMKKDSILEWRRRVGEEEANKISNYASTRGTKIHTILEKYVLNEDNYLQGAMPVHTEMFLQIKNYLDEYCDIVYANELRLYSERIKAAGTCDLIARIHGINTIADFKTSMKLKKEEWIENYFLQCAAYALMLKERENFICPQICVMIATDEGTLQPFIKSTASYIPKLISYFDDYHKKFS
jgi:genome maintenance exonuclease 1